MRRLAGLLFVAVLALVAAGCGGSSQPAATATAPGQPSGPAQVVIDKIGASSTLIPLRKQASGEIETPDVKSPLQAGWYSLGVAPGQPGPAVILGHVDGDGKPGIFKRLNELRVGDVTKVVQEDGRVLTFKAYDVQTAAKESFPTDRVYGDTAGPELRLITCGGVFLGGDVGYAENVIVFLKLDTSGSS